MPLTLCHNVVMHSPDATSSLPPPSPPVPPVLPVLDLRRFRDASTRSAFVAELRGALTTRGFFYLVGTGVPPSTRARAMESARQFFAQPSSSKRTIDSSLSPHVRGFSELGAERTVGAVDIREVWEMGPEAAPLGRAAAAEQPPFMRLQGPNLWPSTPATFQPTIGELFHSLTDVCEELMQGAALALGQDEGYFGAEATGYFADRGTAFKLKCCSYPPTSAAATGAQRAGGSIDSGKEAAAAASPSHGVGPHKDYGFLAVIDSDVAGLQVLDRHGDWLSVPLLEDALVVNSGELLELASGGAFMAATHRVRATGADAGQARLSLCFFYNPGFNAVVRPVPTLPAQLAGAAEANRAVRAAAAAAGEGTDLYSAAAARPYGESALRGYLRSLPHIFEAHHPDLVEADRAERMRAESGEGTEGKEARAVAITDHAAEGGEGGRGGGGEMPQREPPSTTHSPTHFTGGSAPAPHPMDLTLTALAAAVREGRITPLQSVEACLQRIAERDPLINAVSHLCAEAALAEARAQTEAIKAIVETGGSSGAGGKLSIDWGAPLFGCPLLVKDLEDVAGLPTSYGSRLYKDTNIAIEDSVQVQRLRAAGAIVVGKSNCSLFGGNAGCRNRAFGATRNPWNVDLTPGGSSGGSAAAVAARMVPMATAADGGGSIRIPAAICGVFGIKPTRGVVPMTELRQFGMAPFAHCVHFGPVTRSAADAALYLDVVAGVSERDPYSVAAPSLDQGGRRGEGGDGGGTGIRGGGGVYADMCSRPPRRGLRIGFSQTLGVCDVAEEEAVAHAHAALDVLAACLQDVHVDRDFELCLPDMSIHWLKMMATQERLAVKEQAMLDDAAAAVASERKGGDRGGGGGGGGEGGGEGRGGGGGALERDLTGTWDMMEAAVDIDDVGAAHRAVFQLNECLANAFEGKSSAGTGAGTRVGTGAGMGAGTERNGRVDLIATLALPCDPFPATTSNLPSEVSGGGQFESPLHPVFTMIPFNFSGHPAVILRSPVNGTGLGARTGTPWALQIVAPRHQDGLLLQVAAAYEKASGALLTWPEFDGPSRL